MTTKPVIDLNSDTYPDLKDFEISTKTVTIYTNIKHINADLFDLHLPVRMPPLTNHSDLKKNYGKVGDIIGSRNGFNYKGIRKLIAQKQTKPVKGKFPHQITIWVTIEPGKNITAMIFGNGTFNVTGARYDRHLHNMTKLIFNLMRWMAKKDEKAVELPEDGVLHGIVYTHMVDINMKLLQKLGTKAWLIEYFREVNTYKDLKLEYNEEVNGSVTIIFPYKAPENPLREMLTSRLDEDGKSKFSVKLVKKAPFEYKMQKSAATNLTQKFIVHLQSIIQSGRFRNSSMIYWNRQFVGMLKDYMKWVKETKIKTIEKISVDDIFG